MAAWRDVIEGPELWSVEKADALEWLNQLPADSVDCIVSSPPYCDARTYGIDAQRGCAEWVEWMLRVCVAAARVVRGPMFWVVAGVTRDRNYWPACEGLMWEWWKLGGAYQLYRPCVFDRVGIPGSGGEDYLRSDWEYVIAMKRPGKLPWSDNTAMGHPPKWAPGGEMSNRVSNGARVNQWGHDGEGPTAPARNADGSRQTRKRPSHVLSSKEVAGENLFGEPPEVKAPDRTPHGVSKSGSGQRPNGTKKMYARKQAGEDERPADEHYRPPVLANPGNSLEAKYTAEEVRGILAACGVDLSIAPDVVRGKVGGGLMGDDLSHENEAPYPEWLVEFFIRSFCPPGGICCDPFSGSGTTLAVAKKWGRRGVACDLRQSQVALTTRRVKQHDSLYDSLPGEVS